MVDWDDRVPSREEREEFWLQVLTAAIIIAGIAVTGVALYLLVNGMLY